MLQQLRLHRWRRRAGHIRSSDFGNIIRDGLPISPWVSPLFSGKAFNFSLPANNLLTRNLANRSKYRNLKKKNNGRMKRRASHQELLKTCCMLKHSHRLPTYLFSFITFVAINMIAAYTHTDDDYFFYFYPLPFALDIGQGPSMLPTMDSHGINLYWRDCFSHRFVWFNWDHLKKCVGCLLSEQTTTARNQVTLERPWKKGDVVTICNPFTKSIVTKRIIGVEGDSIQVFGEFSREYDIVMEDDIGGGNWDSCGVPRDARFPVPFCQRAPGENKVMSNLSKHETTINLPLKHVWVEGDNPLYSTDSRHYGPLPESALRGRVIMRLWPIGCSTALLSPKRPFPLMNNERSNHERNFGILEDDSRGVGSDD